LSGNALELAPTRVGMVRERTVDLPRVAGVPTLPQVAHYSSLGTEKEDVGGSSSLEVIRTSQEQGGRAGTGMSVSRHCCMTT
jgi:hypothetical protein